MEGRPKHKSLRSTKEVRFGYIVSCWPGIVIAGMIYPMILVSIGLTTAFFSNLGLGANFGWEVLVGVAIYMLIAIFIGMLIAIFFGAFGCVAIWIFNESLGNPLPPRLAATASGGLAGYLPVSFLYMSEIPSASWALLVIVGIFGPVLALVIGSIGAFEYCRRRVEKDVHYVPYRDQPYTLTVKSMLIATLWVGGVFGVTNLLGGLNFAGIVGGWIIVQGIVLLIAARFTPRRSMETVGEPQSLNRRKEGSTDVTQNNDPSTDQSSSG